MKYITNKLQSKVTASVFRYYQAKMTLYCLLSEILLLRTMFANNQKLVYCCMLKKLEKNVLFAIKVTTLVNTHLLGFFC